MLSRSSITAALLAVVVTTGVSGCGLVPGDEADSTAGSTAQPSEPPSEQQSPEPESSESSVSQSPEPSQSSADSAEDQGASGDDVVARATTATTSGAEMEISVHQAVVEEQLLRIRVSYKLTQATEETYSAYDLAGKTDPGVYLIDNVNLQRYSVVVSDGDLLASDVVTTQGVGGPTLTYYFAAPPEDVNSLSLAFNAAPWPAIDVPIER
jgi:uncharacterized protein YfiM (DUF2279 family)